MNKRFLGVLVFAFVVATITSVLLYRVLVKGQQSAAAAPKTVQIVLAARDIEVGTVLKPEDLQVGDWPGTPPAQTSTKLDDLVGRGVITKIVAKEPIIESRLAPKGAGGGLAATIPPGMRAVAIRVNEVVGVAGFVTPGMHVDVLISGSKPGNSNEGLGTLTRTLLQNLEVLSAGQDFKKDAEGKPVQVQVVNLLVTPEQAEQLSLASSQTQVQLVLRNPLDHDIAKTPGTAVKLLFDGGRLQSEAPPAVAQVHRPARVVVEKPVVLAPPPPAKPVPYTMEIISGPKKSEMKFDHPGEGK